VVSVDSPGQITLAETTLNLTNVTVTGAAWGIAVWKTNAVGTVNLRANYDIAYEEHGRAALTDSGASDLCGRNEFMVTRNADGTGAQDEPARLCIHQGFVSQSETSVHVLLTRTGEIRKVGMLQTNFSQGSASTNPDAYKTGVSVSTNPFIDRTDVAYIGRGFVVKTIMMPSSTSPPEISRAIYRGTGKEWEPGYVQWNSLGYPIYGTGNDDVTCEAGEYKYGNLCYSLITKPSLNQSVTQLCYNTDATFAAEWDAGLWNTWDLEAITGDGRYVAAKFQGPGMNQDSIKVLCHIDLQAEGGPAGTWVIATSDPASGGKYGGLHGAGSATVGNYYGGGMATLGRQGGQQTTALAGPLEANVTGVWRSTDGETGTWDTADTSMSSSYQYPCPVNSYGATGSTCVKIRVNSQPCYDNPNTAEKTLYPCPTDANKSNFRNAHWEAGDYASENSSTTEVFRILSVTEVSPTNIELWLHRNAFIDPGPGFWIGSRSATVNGWNLMARPDYACASGDAAEWWIDASGQNQQVVFGDCFKAHGDHGSGPFGKAASNSAQAFRVGHGRDDIEDWRSATRSTVGYGKQITTTRVTGDFSWNSMKPGTDYHNGLQSYPSLRHHVAAASDMQFYADQRAINANVGSNPNTAASAALSSGVTRSEVTAGGRTNVWKFTRSNYTSTSYIKRNTIDRWMGGHTFKQKSGPGSVLTDADTSTFCQVYVSGECIPASDGITTQPGEIYFVPPAGMKVYNPNAACWSGAYDTQVPCFVPSNPTATQGVQWDVVQADSHGFRGRRMGNGFSGPSRQFNFANYRMSPDAKWGFIRSFYADGKMPIAWTQRLPPWPGYDSIRRDTYIKTPITLGAGATYAEIRFGYTEYGTPSQFYCTERMEACSTSSPATLTNPFAFIQTDTRTLTSCSSGCTINVPALPGRMLWWQEYRSADGTAWTAVGKPQPTAIR
jgi:hypothetical protein